MFADSELVYMLLKAQTAPQWMQLHQDSAHRGAWVVGIVRFTTSGHGGVFELVLALPDERVLRVQFRPTYPCVILLSRLGAGMAGPVPSGPLAGAKIDHGVPTKSVEDGHLLVSYVLELRSLAAVGEQADLCRLASLLSAALEASAARLPSRPPASSSGASSPVEWLRQGLPRTPYSLIQGVRGHTGANKLVQVLQDGHVVTKRQCEVAGHGSMVVHGLELSHPGRSNKDLVALRKTLTTEQEAAAASRGAAALANKPVQVLEDGHVVTKRQCEVSGHSSMVHRGLRLENPGCNKAELTGLRKALSGRQEAEAASRGAAELGAAGGHNRVLLLGLRQKNPGLTEEALAALAEMLTTEQAAAARSQGAAALGEKKNRKAAQELVDALKIGAFVVSEGRVKKARKITCPSGHTDGFVVHALTGPQRGRCNVRCPNCKGPRAAKGYTLGSVEFGDVCDEGPGPLQAGYTVMGARLFPPGGAPLDDTAAGVAGQPGSAAAAADGPGPSCAAGAAAAAATADAGRQQAPRAGTPAQAAAAAGGRQQQQQQQQQQRQHQQRQQRQRQQRQRQQRQRRQQQPPAEPDVIVISDDDSD